jgi:hypothetical protein
MIRFYEDTNRGLAIFLLNMADVDILIRSNQRSGRTANRNHHPFQRKLNW